MLRTIVLFLLCPTVHQSDTLHQSTRRPPDHQSQTRPPDTPRQREPVPETTRATQRARHAPTPSHCPSRCPTVPHTHPCTHPHTHTHTHAYARTHTHTHTPALPSVSFTEPRNAPHPTKSTSDRLRALQSLTEPYRATPRTRDPDHQTRPTICTKTHSPFCI